MYKPPAIAICKFLCIVVHYVYTVADILKGAFIMKLRGIIIGLVLGFALSLSISSFAEGAKEYILYQADYPLYVRGEQYVNNEKPILNYRGMTYVPLTAMAAMLGIDIEWDSANKALNIEKTEVLKSMESSGTTSDKLIKEVLPKDGQYVIETINGKECTLIEVGGIKYIKATDLRLVVGMTDMGLDTSTGIRTYKKGDITIEAHLKTDEHLMTNMGSYYKLSLFTSVIEGV
jgi:hypothetical protein